jgi:DNA-binding MarR family transcriptional regulator
MRALRAGLRRSQTSALSEQQLRAMAYLRRHAEDSVSAVAECLGLGLPTTSKLVEGLVRHGYVRREVAPQDRRRARLALTEEGRQVLEGALVQVDARVLEDLEALSEEEVAAVRRGVEVLRGVYGGPAPP